MKQFTINSNLTLTADEVVNAANNILCVLGEARAALNNQEEK